MSWFQRIKDKFGVTLTEELRDWCDSEMWESVFVGEFNEFISPESLLDPESYTIWGGQMLPDMLPIASNGGGDVLAVRIGPKGEAVEVAQWNHEGGFCSPWGATFAEALLFNFAQELDSEELDGEFFEENKKPVLDWMLKWLAKEGVDADSLQASMKPGQAVHAVLNAGLCQVVINAGLADSNLTTGLSKKARSGGFWDFMEKHRLVWETTSTWCTQPETIPKKYRGRLEKHFGASFAELASTNMSAAVECAKRVVALRTDLAWPYAVLAREAQEKGDEVAEAEFMAKELRAPWITYDFAQIWVDGMLKQTERFERLRDHLSKFDDFEFLRLKDEGEPRPYWTKKAEEAERTGDHASAYRYWFLAGWDAYHCDGIEPIMEGLQRSAKAAGYDALARVIEHHLKNVE